MALASIKARLNKIRTKNNTGEMQRIAELLAKGAYYSELTEEERQAYKRYKESGGGVADDIAGAELEIIFMNTPKEEAYNFPLTRRKSPPTPEEHAQRVREVEAYIQALTDEYNTPEAKAKREADYQEMRRIGELRRQAHERGETMSNYPLPWERGRQYERNCIETPGKPGNPL